MFPLVSFFFSDSQLTLRLWELFTSIITLFGEAEGPEIRGLKFNYSKFITVLYFYYQPGKPVVDYIIKVRFAMVCFRRIIIDEKFQKNSSEQN